MDLVAARRAERLPCGAEVAALIEQVTDGRGAERSAHQLSCEHCQALLAELGRLWAPVRRLVREHVPVPPGLVAAVMRRVHQLVVATWLGVRVGARGTTQITQWVVAKLAARAAREVPGVHAALTRIEAAPTNEPTATRTPRADGHAEVTTGRTAVDLELVTQYGQSIVQVANAVRDNVIDRIESMTGLEVTQVDITVDDVTLERGAD